MYTPTSLDSQCTLSRHGGVAYAAQESWVLSETIRVVLQPSYPGLGFLIHHFRTTSYMARLTKKNDTRKACLQWSPSIAADTESFLVLTQCALDKDLSMYEAGDMTEVGEKGITLR